MAQPPLSQTDLIVSKLKNNEITADELMNVKLPSLSQCLNEFIGKRDISVQALADLSGINRATIFKILSGKLEPSFNTLIRLAFVLELDFEQAQFLLKCGNCHALSASRNRDLIIIEGLVHRMPLGEVEDKLLDHGLRGLLGKS